MSRTGESYHCALSRILSPSPSEVYAKGRDPLVLPRGCANLEALGFPEPLVLALHPNGSDASYFDVLTGGRAIRPQVADKAFLVLAEADDGD